MIDNQDFKRKSDRFDYKYSRPESFDKEKFCSTLNLLESERHNLLESIRDLEKKHENQIEKNLDLSRNLNFHSDHIKQLENDKSVLVDKIKILQATISDFEGLHSSMTNERSALRASVAQLQEETERYRIKYGEKQEILEKIAGNYTLEKETILGVHEKHSRLLSSKILADSISRQACKRKGWGFYHLKQALRENLIAAKLVLKTVDRRVRHRLHQAFEFLQKNSNNIKTEALKNNLVRKISDKSSKKRILNAIFEYTKRRKARKALILQGVQKIKMLERLRNFLRVFQSVQQWKNVKIKDLYGRKLLMNVIYSKFNKIRCIYLKYWSNVNKILKNLQAKEDLATELSAYSLKQNIFCEIKRITGLSTQKRKIKLFMKRILITKNKSKVLFELKKQTQLQKLKIKRLSHIASHFSIKSQTKCLTAWKHKTKDTKKYKNLQKVFINKEKIHKNLSIQKIFISWKLYRLTKSYTKVQNELSKEKPKRIQYEEAYLDLYNTNNKILLTKSIEKMIKTGSKSIKNYFTIWHTRIYEFQAGKKRIGRLFMKLYSNTIESRFNQWKSITQSLSLNQMFIENSETTKENELLLDHISNLESCLQQALTEKALISALSVKNVFLLLQKKQKTLFLRAWARRSGHIKSIVIGCKKLDGVFKLALESRGYNRIYKYFLKSKKDAIRDRKIYIQTYRKWTRINYFIIKTWVQYVKVRKFHRSLLSKLQTRKYKNTVESNFKYWKDLNIYLRQCQEIEKHNVMEIHLAQLQEELEETCNSLSVQIENNWKLKQSFNNSLLIVCFNTIARSYLKTLKFGYWTWINSMKHKKQLKSRLYKLFKINYRLHYKDVIKRWVDFKKIFNKINTESTFNTLVIEKKGIRREMNQLKTKLETIIQEKEAQISDNIIKHEKLNNTLEKFLELSVKKRNRCIVVNRSQWAFRAWKEIYQTKKKVLNRVFKVIKKAKIRMVFCLVHEFSNKILQSIEVKQLIVSLFISFKFRKLKHAFNFWKVNQFKIEERLQSNEVQTILQKLEILGLRHRNSKKKTILKSFNYIINKKKYFIIKSWIKVTKTLKRLKNSQKIFKKVSITLKLTLGLQEMLQHKNTQVRKRLITKKVLENRKDSLKSWVFNNWHYSYSITKKLQKSVLKISERLNRENICYSIGCMKALSLYQYTFSNWKCFTQTGVLKSIFIGYYKANLSIYFKKWSRRCSLLLNISKKISLIISSTDTRIKNKMFNKWNNVKNTTKAVEYTEKYGKTAYENQKLLNLGYLYQKFIKSEGLSPEHLEKYLIENLSLKEILEKKGITKSNLKSSAFLAWKYWIIKKSKYLKTAHRLQAYKRKGEVIKALNRWKKCYPLFSLSIKSMPRVILLDTLAKMDRDVNTLKQSIKEKHLSIRYMESYTDILESHVRRGQNQALCNCAGNIRKALKTAVFKWSSQARTQKIFEIFYKLKDLETELAYVRRKCKEYDIENKELMIENQGLAKSLYETSEINNKFKALNAQYQRLNGDLQEKNDIIRKLVQENRQLIVELSGKRY